LVSPSTLQESAHLSLAERAQLFHRRFGEKKISPSTIRRIYLKHKIRFKNIKRGKREIDFTEPHYRSLFNRMHSLLKQMRESNTQVIYLDETMFTFSTFRAKGWAHNRDRIRVNDSKLRVTTLAVIAAISEEHGLIDYVVHPKAINTEVFVAFISQIAEKLGGGDFALFLDNLSVHKTKDAKHLFEKLNITEIFNVPYCLQFNGIESYFSQLKATYKKLLLKCVINDAPYDTMGLIKQSIESVSNDNATRCVRYALA
jgi:transposase